MGIGKGASLQRGDPKTDALYSLMQSYENKLGGGEGIEGLYGSITQQSMQKVLDALKHNTGLDQRSVFIDIGAGLGRPLLHAMVSALVAGAWGVELDRVKCDKATAFCGHVVNGMIAKGFMGKTTEPPAVICKPVEKVDSLEPATHAYSFWEGVPVSGKKAFGRLFAQSRTLRAVAVVQRAMRGQEPAAVMLELGFGRLLLLASFPVKMSGSGRSFTAYVFSKIAPAAATFLDAVEQGRAAPLTDTSSCSSSFASEANHSGRETHGAGACGSEQEEVEQEQQRRARQVARKSLGAARLAGGVQQEEEQGRQGGGASATEQAATSPSKTRRTADSDGGLSTPTKKPCTGSPARSPGGSPPHQLHEQQQQHQEEEASQLVAACTAGAARVAGQGRAGGRGSKGKLFEDSVQADTQPRPHAGAVGKGAQKQKQLTAIPEFSRRTKVAVGVEQGKGIGRGRGGQEVGKTPATVAAGAMGTRSSRRLAAKAEALAVAAGAEAVVEV